MVVFFWIFIIFPHRCVCVFAWVCVELLSGGWGKLLHIIYQYLFKHFSSLGGRQRHALLNSHLTTYFSTKLFRLTTPFNRPTQKIHGNSRYLPINFVPPPNFPISNQVLPDFSRFRWILVIREKRAQFFNWKIFFFHTHSTERFPPFLHPS